MTAVDVDMFTAETTGWAEHVGLTGGRTAPRFVVSSLADSGPGTYRDALSSGDRYVTFDPRLAGGTIVLASAVHSAGSNLTVDGSGANITITKYATKFSGTNVVIAGLRFARMDGSSNEDALTFRSPATDQVFGVFGNTFETATDGLLDVIWNDGHDVFGTVCGNRFAHHDKAMLVHSGDPSREGGRYHLTLCRNWWYDIHQRAPFSRDAVVHQYNDVFDSYGAPDGSGGGSKSGASTFPSQHLLTDNVAVPRHVGEISFTGQVTTRPREEVAGPQWGSGGAIRVERSLLIERAGTTPTVKESSPSSVTAPPYPVNAAPASNHLATAVRDSAGTCRPRAVHSVDPCAAFVSAAAGSVIPVRVVGDPVEVTLRIADLPAVPAVRSSLGAWTVTLPPELSGRSGWADVVAIGADGSTAISDPAMLVVG